MTIECLLKKQSWKQIYGKCTNLQQIVAASRANPYCTINGTRRNQARKENLVPGAKHMSDETYLYTRYEMRAIRLYEAIFIHKVEVLLVWCNSETHCKMLFQEMCDKFVETATTNTPHKTIRIKDGIRIIFFTEARKMFGFDRTKTALMDARGMEAIL